MRIARASDEIDSLAHATLSWVPHPIALHEGVGDMQFTIDEYY
jgi:hypothetical protein